MSDRIYAAITEDFIRRMRNWARYDAGCGLSEVSGIYTGIGADGYGTDSLIVLEGEASDTAVAIGAVSVRYRSSVVVFWRFEKLPLRRMAQKVRVDLNYHTFESWVIKGHMELRSALAVRASIYHAMACANRSATNY
jgi:hypothetical protein